MKATETKVEAFLSTSKTQFVIPVYQRNYDWGHAQCEQLLNDIIDVGSHNDMNGHFIGSIVHIHDDIYTASRIKELTIIDGQQRLTTLTLLYLALYKLAKEQNNEGLANEINETYLINKFAAEDSKLKLKPTENNEEAFKYLLRADEGEEYLHYSKLVENFRFFKRSINQENFQTVQIGLSKLIFVEVSLERGKDDPQRIFESLNSTGLDLSQADLIRNYILMDLKPEDQNSIYKNYWEVIEKSAKDDTRNISKVSDFIRDFLTLKNKKIPKKDKVYQEFKQNYNKPEPELLKALLAEMKALAKHYYKLINPEKESDKDIRLQLEYIDKLDINVSFPFLMKVYDDYANAVIDKKTFIKILELVQSFAWRRFVLSLPTNALNKIFMNLYERVEKHEYLSSIQRSLVQRSGTQRFPKDTEVKDTLKFKDYYNINPKNRKYLLDRLENYENTERVDIESSNITIEHIFPQNPEPDWKTELGEEEYKIIEDNYLNTLANLTLSGNNGKLGNKTFLAKRDLPNAGYKDSRLWLNKSLALLDRWGRAEIEARFEVLADRCIKIWPYPNIAVESNDEDGYEVNIFEAEDPKYKKLEYAIFLDQTIEVTQVADLYEEVFRQLFARNEALFFETELGKRIGLTTNPQPSSTARQPKQIHNSYYIEGNLDNKGKFERIKYALGVFDLKDELFIKYAPGNGKA